MEAVLAREPLAQTRLVLAGDEVLQEIDEGGAMPAPILVDLAREAGVATAEAFIERDRQRPLDLFRLPLWRSYLIRDRAGEYTAGIHIFKSLF